MSEITMRVVGQWDWRHEETTWCIRKHVTEEWKEHTNIIWRVMQAASERDWQFYLPLNTIDLTRLKFRCRFWWDSTTFCRIGQGSRGEPYCLFPSPDCLYPVVFLKIYCLRLSYLKFICACINVCVCIYVCLCVSVLCSTWTWNRTMREVEELKSQKKR